MLRAAETLGEKTADDRSILADRAAQADLLEAELERVRTERDRLEIELLIARGWVRELGVWLDAVHESDRARRRVSGDELFGLLSQFITRVGAERRSERRGMAVVVGASVLLWAILAVLGFLVVTLLR